MVKHPAGDVLAYLDDTYQIPTVLVTTDGETSVTQQTMTTVEMWMNPQTGVIEPFVALRVDKNGRLPIARTSMLTIEEERPEPEPEPKYPDWGGKFGGLGLSIDGYSTAVWVAALLFDVGLLWLILHALRNRG